MGKRASDSRQSIESIRKTVLEVQTTVKQLAPALDTINELGEQLLTAVETLS